MLPAVANLKMQGTYRSVTQFTGELPQGITVSDIDLQTFVVLGYTLYFKLMARTASETQ
jgi:hypothetical protein